MASGDSSAPAAARISWRAKLLLIFLGLALPCVGLEIALRVHGAVTARSATARANIPPAPKAEFAAPFIINPKGEFWATHDPDLHYRGTPGFADLNADGLRDHPIGPKAGRFRVLMLGDSVGFYGDNVDDTVTGHLSATLRRDGVFQRVDIINASMKGYSNLQELRYLKKYGLKFEPDLVGVQFCLNDLITNLTNFRVENGRLVPNTYGENREERRQSLSRAQRFWEGMKNRSYFLRWASQKTYLAANYVGWRIRRGYSFDYNWALRKAWRDEDWKPLEEQLREMVELGRQHHFGVFLVVLPLQVQYDPAYLARDRDYVLKPQRKLREICNRRGIPFYDLYPDLHPGLFEVEDGVHFAKAGRQRAGQSIAAFLMKSKLIPVSDGAAAPVPKASRK